MAYDWDVIVMGSGAGGATFAYACARAGKSVLLVERGQKYMLPEPVHDERAMLIDKKPYDDRAIAVNDVPKRLYMGGVLGGGTSLYGAALFAQARMIFIPANTMAAASPALSGIGPSLMMTWSPIILRPSNYSVSQVVSRIISGLSIKTDAAFHANLFRYTPSTKNSLPLTGLRGSTRSSYRWRSIPQVVCDVRRAPATSVRPAPAVPRLNSWSEG